MTTRTLQLLLLSTLVAALPQNVEPLRLANRLHQRQTGELERGWAIRAIDSCPPGTDACEGAVGMRVCCPSDTICYTGATMYTSGKYAMCCLPGDEELSPSGKDKDQFCFDRLKELPVCANPSENTLWIGSSVAATHHPFCCPEGQVGFVGTDYAPGCAEKGTEIPTSREAETMAQATRNGSASASSRTSSASGAPRTSTGAGATPTGSGGNDSDAAQDGSNGRNGEGKPEKSNNIGAIVGGVVGGVVGLALIWLAWKVFNRVYPKHPKDPAAAAGGVDYPDGGRAELDQDGAKAPPPYVMPVQETTPTDRRAEMAGNRAVSPLLGVAPVHTVPAQSPVVNDSVEMPGSRFEGTSASAASPLAASPSNTTPVREGVMFEADGRPVERA
ncbi:hypothetical protein BJ508DRAFT_170661 [Ascobolus immersus RN42]|uniref:Mid2 domain-containing protein n=1 Tax=Ascobolus immersus RN42 TaxID=1160509 RepID=A0A3N4HZU0_ASCIM|nr:hypothetical protein BJ508DRAFT_170661 [Ascobolus immersus RN42]